MQARRQRQNHRENCHTLEHHGVNVTHGLFGLGLRAIDPVCQYCWVPHPFDFFCRMVGKLNPEWADRLRSSLSASASASHPRRSWSAGMLER